ncbi:MAG TPA: histidine kinase [Nocardioides sp.]|nr:histidine kinase [Nocardioides sp.]
MDLTHRAPRPSKAALLDVALATAFLAVGLYEVLVRPLAEDVVGGPDWINVLAVVAGTVPLAWRRRAPLATALVVSAALAGRALAAEPLEVYPTTLALLVTAYSVASYAPLRDALLAAGFAALAIAVAVVQGSGTAATPDPLPAAVLYGTVWLVGRVVGVRHQRAETLHRERETLAAEAVAEERARIAREMHDVVSHSLAAIVMQSGGAANVLDTDPDRARQSLATIEATARRGLEEMRRMLGLLGDTEAELAPQPGLDRIDDLLSTARSAGLDVECRVAGDGPALPAAVDVSAFRIVQESLTNVMKHARADRVQIEVRREPDHLAIDVVDDGLPAEGGAGAGRGLAGMRERAEVLGGSLHAGPRADGRGFRVAARLPL